MKKFFVVLNGKIIRDFRNRENALKYYHIKEKTIDPEMDVLEFIVK